MATSQSATTNTSNSGGMTTTGGGLVGWRDANLSVGGFDLSGIGSDRSSVSSRSGDITSGDRIIGGQKTSFKFGIVKILVLIAGVAVITKILKGKKNG